MNGAKLAGAAGDCHRVHRGSRLGKELGQHKAVGGGSRGIQSVGQEVLEEHQGVLGLVRGHLMPRRPNGDEVQAVVLRQVAAHLPACACM